MYNSSKPTYYQTLLEMKQPPLVLTPKPDLLDINKLPIPDRSLIDYSKYAYRNSLAYAHTLINLQGTRGCPYQCTYCHRIMSKTLRTRSPESIFCEIEYYYTKGIRRFSIIDDIFNLKTEIGFRLFKMILDAGMKIQLFFPNGLRGDVLTEEYIDLMIDAGTVGFALALESASARIQKMIKKNLDLEKFHKNIDYITRKHPNVVLDLFTMIGFPTETEEEMKKTLDFVKSIRWIHFPGLHLVKVYPGTELAQTAIDSGISRETIDRNADSRYHEYNPTLNFPKEMIREVQIEFYYSYFLNKERLQQVLPIQMGTFSEAELTERYNDALPFDINTFEDFLSIAGLRKDQLSRSTFNETFVADKQAVMNVSSGTAASNGEDSFKILLIDATQMFSASKSLVSEALEQPLGLLYLLTYLNQNMNSNIDGRITKSGVDFDTFEAMETMIRNGSYDLIGLRGITCYADFFHECTARIRLCGFGGPIVVGGPYPSSGHEIVLRDTHIDLAVIGEGEDPFLKIVQAIMENNNALPGTEILESIPGIAFRK